MFELTLTFSEILIFKWYALIYEVTVMKYNFCNGAISWPMSICIKSYQAYLRKLLLFPWCNHRKILTSKMKVKIMENNYLSGTIRSGIFKYINVFLAFFIFTKNLSVRMKVTHTYRNVEVSNTYTHTQIRWSLLL